MMQLKSPKILLLCHYTKKTLLSYELYGVVEKLNPKKALVRLGNGEQWAVSYSLLFLIMDGVSIQAGQLFIEGEVIK